MVNPFAGSPDLPQVDKRCRADRMVGYGKVRYGAATRRRVAAIFLPNPIKRLATGKRRAVPTRVSAQNGEFLTRARGSMPSCETGSRPGNAAAHEPPTNVRFRGKSGKHSLYLSISHFDPKATWTQLILTLTAA
jgi:hypothetical protein